MDIRPMVTADLDRLGDIDATIESVRYLHLDRQGEKMSLSWKLEERPLREKLIQSNPLDDDRRFSAKQIVSGIEEGVALVAEHEGTIVGLLIAQPDLSAGIMRILDVRVDYDYRRQGLAMAMIYQLVLETIQAELRAVTMRTRTQNYPASAFLVRCGFELAGVNTHRQSNHDLVKEEVTLYWYLALD